MFPKLIIVNSFLNKQGLEDALNEPLDDDELGEEEEYDALNDETFGSEATMGDWEQDHEKLSQITESTRPYHQNATNNNRVCNYV